MLHYKKIMYMTCFACFCLLSVVFNISAISVERRAVEADIITYLSKAHEENHQCLAYRNAMRKVKSIWKRDNHHGSLGPIWEGSNVYKCILILRDFPRIIVHCLDWWYYDPWSQWPRKKHPKVEARFVNGWVELKWNSASICPWICLNFLFAFVMFAHVHNLGELKIGMNDSKLC